MKKLLLAGALALGSFVNAQVPDYGVLSQNIVITDVNGVQHDIYDILDQGKPVILDLFAEWCGPCWNYHNAGTGHPNGGALKDLYNQYGPSGTDELMVMAIETDESTPASTLQGGQGTQGWDWITGTPYPIANEDIRQLFNQTAFPTIVVVCPDRSVTQVGQWNVSQLYNAAMQCEAAPTHANDPRLLESLSDEIFCTGETAQISVVMQNFGSNPMTSATIEVLDGSNVVLTENWSGNLAQFEVAEITIGNVAPSAATNYQVTIADANDDTSNDAVTAAVSPAPVLEVGSGYSAVTVDLIIDDYASELGIVFDEGGIPSGLSPVQIHNAAAADPTSVLGFAQVGSIPDGTNEYANAFTVSNAGCHFILFVDSYGDGINFQKPDAKIDIIGAGQSSISLNPGFGSSVFQLMDIQFVNDLSVLGNDLVQDFKLYPNPASNAAKLSFDLQAASNAEVQIVNMQGQLVSVQPLGVLNGSNTVDVNLTDLDSGMYMVNLKTEAGVATSRLSVVK